MAAKPYLEQGQMNKMKSMLDRLPNIMDRVVFFTENNQINEAILTLKSAGGSISLLKFDIIFEKKTQKRLFHFCLHKNEINSNNALVHVSNLEQRIFATTK